jgi:hypothetical protein
MFTSTSLSAVIAWSSAALVILAGVVGYRLMMRRERRGLALVCLLLIPLGLLIGISRQGHGTPVVIVRSIAGSITREPQRLYGTATFQYTDGHAQQISWAPARTILINDTPLRMTLETVSYGLGASKEEELGPFRSMDLGGPLDFFGPGDHPPTEISSTYGDTRYWLRW